MTPAASIASRPTPLAALWVALSVAATTAAAQTPKPPTPVTAPAKAVTPIPKPPPPPKQPPATDWEKATAFAKKHQYDQACPLFEKATHVTADSAALWNDLGQCEWHRGHRKQAVDAAQHAVVLGDRGQRRTAYLTLHAVGEKVELPDKDCEWLAEMPGACDDQMWACAYPWEQHPTPQHKVGGRALTFGVNDDERDVLEQALRDNTALREQLAMEWKALTVDGSDERVCTVCHSQAADSADGLVTARASACFQQKLRHAPPSTVCVQPDAECDAFNACLDDAWALAHRAEVSRGAWPEAAEVIAAAHKVCDATCGVVTRTSCDVVAFDACRGFVGWACIKRARGHRPQVSLGEIALDDAKSNWNEVEQPPAPPPPAPPAPHAAAPVPGDTTSQAARHQR